MLEIHSLYTYKSDPFSWENYEMTDTYIKYLHKCQTIVFYPRSIVTLLVNCTSKYYNLYIKKGFVIYIYMDPKTYIKKNFKSN